MFARGRSNYYGYAANGLTALAEQQNGVYDHFTEVADYKEIQSLTHFEDSVEDRRTTDLAWLTQQDQD